MTISFQVQFIIFIFKAAKLQEHPILLWLKALNNSTRTTKHLKVPTNSMVANIWNNND